MIKITIIPLYVLNIVWRGTDLTIRLRYYYLRYFFARNS